MTQESKKNKMCIRVGFVDHGNGTVDLKLGSFEILKIFYNNQGNIKDLVNSTFPEIDEPVHSMINQFIALNKESCLEKPVRKTAMELLDAFDKESLLSESIIKNHTPFLDFLWWQKVDNAFDEPGLQVATAILTSYGGRIRNGEIVLSVRSGVVESFTFIPFYLSAWRDGTEPNSLLYPQFHNIEKEVKGKTLLEAQDFLQRSKDLEKLATACWGWLARGIELKDELMFH